MSRRKRIAPLLFLISMALPAWGAILPDGIELHTRKAVTPLKATDPELWKEYGFQEGESAIYEGTGRVEKGKPAVERRFTVSAWRWQDSTAALAGWQLMRTPAAKPTSSATANAVLDGGALLLAYGNYVLRFDGYMPEEETIHQLVLHVPRFEKASLPALPGFVPTEARVANSERYISGPVGLERFEPGIPPSVAAFHFGTEGQTSRFQDRDGEVRMVVFSYPNHQIAQKQITAFQELPGLTASRQGPLIAVVTKAPNPNAAERVLSRVRYEATVTLNTQPKPQESVADMILAIGKLALYLIGGALLAGLLFAGFRMATGGGFGNVKARNEAVLSLGLDEEAPKRP